jgi:hypothetical protein
MIIDREDELKQIAQWIKEHGATKVRPSKGKGKSLRKLRSTKRLKNDAQNPLGETSCGNCNR